MGGGAGLRLLGIPGVPEIREGENLASVLAAAQLGETIEVSVAAG